MLLSEDQNKVVYECANYTTTVGNLLSSLICVSILNARKLFHSSFRPIQKFDEYFYRFSMLEHY